ncbi:ABC transporter, substrate-binding protein (cluster 15, trp?) [Olavius algarvensis Delta 1 endosymbiont]|nr:ABC transporter, substrate-binding protein (cluster 15, trp?) [Olavius algarvensis Delta 1 endosymbiont]
MTHNLRCIVLAMIIAALIIPGAAQAKTFKIGVTVIVSHPALEADQQGFEKAIAEAGLEAEYDYQNAQGDMANATTIAQKFKNDDLDLVHAIATPTSQAAVKVIKNKPIVYSSVTDPVDAGLVKTMGPSGTNVTGISDAWPIERQIELYHQMLPSAKKWGTVYNAGDANSVKSISWTRDAMKKFGLELIEVTISNSAEVYTGAQTLVGRVDAIYITSDNTVVSALESVVKVANNKKIPLFGGDTTTVEKGMIAAYGLNYFQVGYSAGKKAVLVLKGQAPGTVPSGLTENLSLWINLKAAMDQKVTVPEKFVKMAEKVFR